MYGAPNYQLPTGMDTAPGTSITPRGLGHPQAGGLGLGLGLNALNRGRFLEAAQQGNAEQFMATRPWLQHRIENRIQAGSPQETGLQNMIATGQAPSGVLGRHMPDRDLQAGGGGDIDRGMTPEESGAGTMDRGGGMEAAQDRLQAARQGRHQAVRAARQQARPDIMAARQNLRGMRRGGGRM